MHLVVFALMDMRMSLCLIGQCGWEEEAGEGHGGRNVRSCCLNLCVWYVVIVCLFKHLSVFVCLLASICDVCSGNTSSCMSSIILFIVVVDIDILWILYDEDLSFLIILLVGSLYYFL